MVPSDTSLEPLLPLIAAGEPAAVGAAMERYGRLVWSIARRFASSVHDAEDLVQDIWLALWKHAAQYDAALGAEPSYVAMVSRRRCIDRLRRQRRQPGAVTLPEREPEGPAPVPHEEAERADEIARARRALAQLRPEQRKVLELAIDHGWTHQHIAEQLALPLGTVKTHARRGMIRLRELLG